MLKFRIHRGTMTRDFEAHTREQIFMLF